MTNKKISIIIPTKNGGRFLPRAITSIERQTEKDIEAIIISDGSTDNTAASAYKLAETRPWLRVIELMENIGPGLARDKAIHEAQGEYIALLDDDDEWIDTDKLKNQKEFLSTHPDYVLVGASKTEFVRENGEHMFVDKKKETDEGIRKHILLHNQFITSSVMFRKDTYTKTGGFPNMYLAEDYDLWLRMGKIGKMANLDHCMTRYYMRKGGAYYSHRREMNKIVLDLVKKYKKDYPNFYLALIKGYMRIMKGCVRGR